jgi:ABC-type oligopeptide transport system substrate-binding subunit
MFRLKHLFQNTVARRVGAAILCAALCVTLVLPLAACGSETNSFTWFVEDLPTNLDPQIASANADIIACTNLYSGLVRENPDGELVNELCESYTVSPDGLTYTFQIKPGLTYRATKGAATEYAITAEDFVFAFRRMFRRATASPYAADFACIANSAAVLAGELPESALGVKAKDELTLVFSLSTADESFLSKLTLPGAMPCDEEFFTSTKGTYGLSTATTLSSGSFYIYSWTASGLFLRRSAETPLVDNLRLVQNTTSTSSTPEQLILNERCSAALDDSAAATTLPSVSYSDTTWCLLFNCSGVFANTSLRQALAAEVLSSDLDDLLPASSLYSTVQGLVPAGVTVDGLDYRTAAGSALPRLSAARTLYAEARETITSADLRGVTLLVPASAGLTQTAEAINSLWQKDLSLFLSIEEVGDDVFETRLAQGNYTIALAPVSMTSGSAYNLLASFSASGLTGYDDETYADTLEQAAAVTGSARVKLLAAAEKQLLNDCAAVPLFSQQKRLLLAEGISGLVFDPFGPVLDLTYTTKE